MKTLLYLLMKIFNILFSSVLCRQLYMCGVESGDSTVQDVALRSCETYIRMNTQILSCRSRDEYLEKDQKRVGSRLIYTSLASIYMLD